MITREAQKEYNAELYPASVLTRVNEATDRAFNIFEKIKVCKNCKHFSIYEYEIPGAEDFTNKELGCSLRRYPFKEDTIIEKTPNIIPNIIPKKLL